MADTHPAAGTADRPSCPVYGKCGGCTLLNMDYPRQLSYKTGGVIKLLGRFGHVSEIHGMEDPYHYRCKVQAAFTTTRGGAVISGVYKSSTHNVVKTDSCLIEDETADKIIVFIRGLVKKYRLTVYDERTGRGFLRHVLIRRAKATGEVLVVLVTGTPVFPRKNDFINDLLDFCPYIVSVVQDVNDGHTSMVLSGREKVLYGSGRITDVLCGCRFMISASSFYQINPAQTQWLYDKAIELAELDDKSNVVDAYCGVGTIALIAAKRAAHVTGVELNRAAVGDAIANARLNGIKNAVFVCADASEFLKEASQAGDRADVLFMDPPRSGSTEEFMSAVCAASPDRVVYISCCPETLARDLTYFTANGYKASVIQPVDMFPWTTHVETVVLMSNVQK